MVPGDSTSDRLLIGLRSPFARRVRLVMERLGVKRVEEVMNLFEETPELNRLNPLGLVPTLVTQDAGVLFDSTLILDYLDEKTHGVWTNDAKIRIQEKQASVLAVGLMQTTVNLFQETEMHEAPSLAWIRDYEETIARTLIQLSRLPDQILFTQRRLTQPGWDLAVALEYLDFRFPKAIQEKTRPEFLGILTEARRNLYFLETRPVT